MLRVQNQSINYKTGVCMTKEDSKYERILGAFQVNCKIRFVNAVMEFLVKEWTGQKLNSQKALIIISKLEAEFTDCNYN